MEDLEHTLPGPIDTSVRTLQARRRSQAIVAAVTALRRIDGASRALMGEQQVPPSVRRCLDEVLEQTETVLRMVHLSRVHDVAGPGEHPLADDRVGPPGHKVGHGGGLSHRPPPQARGPRLRRPRQRSERRKEQPRVRDAVLPVPPIVPTDDPVVLASPSSPPPPPASTITSIIPFSPPRLDTTTFLVVGSPPVDGQITQEPDQVSDHRRGDQEQQAPTSYTTSLATPEKVTSQEDVIVGYAGRGVRTHRSPDKYTPTLTYERRNKKRRGPDV